jgi:hypothetical protein
MKPGDAVWLVVVAPGQTQAKIAGLLFGLFGTYFLARTIWKARPSARPDLIGAKRVMAIFSASVLLLFGLLIIAVSLKGLVDG